MTHYGHMARILHWQTDQAITSQLEQMELTASQGRVLGFLALRKSPPCPRDIEEEFHLSHPTISGLLTRLEKKGFLTLEPDPGDRRCKRIFITEKGAAINQTIYDTIVGMEQQMVQDFTPEEKECFAKLLTRAVHNMGGCSCGPKHKEEDAK